MANNLMRDEARARAALIDVTSYAISLDLTTGSTRGPGPTFGSTSRVLFSCTSPGAATFLELAAAAVRSASLNGVALDPAEVFDGERITLTGLAADNELVVEADCVYSNSGEGLHRFVDPVDSSVYLYTQFETYDAHRVYGCFDQPDLKATFAFEVLAPAEWTVVSNAPLAADAAPTGDGARVWTFDPTKRMSTYITAIVAGPYVSVHDTYADDLASIPLGLYCRKSMLPHLEADEIFTITKQGFGFYHKAFASAYPFEKYDQLMVPEFNAGAMENAGCVTFHEDYLFRSKVTEARRERRASTILHEMAHMWFGDLVTMRWWDDLWLNESFATFMSTLAQVEATRFQDGWTTFANSEKSWARRQDQLASTHPVVADAVDMEAVKTNFDGITYAKGASLLKQLVAWVGQEEFLAGLREYFQQHAWGNTDLADLLTALERASGRNLTAWSREWLETTGVDTLRPRLETDADGVLTAASVEQTATAEHPTLRSHRITLGLYDSDEPGGPLLRRERQEIDVVGAETEVPKLVGLPRGSLVLLDDEDLTYAKVRLDPESLATVVSGIDRIFDTRARALCWSAAWDMTRDAEMSAGDYVALVLRGVPHEGQVGVVSSLLAQARLAALVYSDPARRADRVQALSEGAFDLARVSTPGSDLQLAATQAFVGGAGPAQGAILHDLLGDGEPLPGLAVDTDLRWSLVVRLAILGLADDDLIDAELDRDKTAAGERRAVTARAARPTVEAKEAAWTAVIDSDQMSNHMQASTMAGFAQIEQEDLLAPWVERYFDVVGPLWRSRTLDTAQTVTQMLFPSWSIHQETVDRVEAYLRDAAPQPALRRCVVEGRDGLTRALAAQRKDATG